MTRFLKQGFATHVEIAKIQKIFENPVFFGKGVPLFSNSGCFSEKNGFGHCSVAASDHFWQFGIMFPTSRMGGGKMTIQACHSGTFDGQLEFLKISQLRCEFACHYMLPGPLVWRPRQTGRSDRRYSAGDISFPFVAVAPAGHRLGAGVSTNRNKRKPRKYS